MKTAILFCLLIGSVSIWAASCGKAHGTSIYAEVVPSPLAGYTCFAIRTESGSAIGGNCVSVQND